MEEAKKCPKCGWPLVDEGLEWKCPKCGHTVCIEPEYCSPVEDETKE